MSVVRQPPFAPLRHYYSPLTDSADGRRAAGSATRTVMPAGRDIDLDEMARLAWELGPMLEGSCRTNAPYKQASTTKTLTPRSIIRRRGASGRHRFWRSGSGYSTAVALDTFEAYDLPTRIQCVEPHPERLFGLLKGTDQKNLPRNMVQDVPLSTYTKLGPGDFLFLDSTHVVKAGPTVVWTTSTPSCRHFRSG